MNPQRGRSSTEVGIGAASAVLLAFLLVLSAWVPGEAGPDKVSDSIAALLDPNSSVRVREQAARSLEEIGDPRVVEPLIAALRDPDSSVRVAAANALGVIHDPRVVEPLIATLRDPDSSVRWAAAEPFKVIRDPRAVEPLIAALRDPDSLVRKVAASGLWKNRDPRAVEPLIAALRDPDPSVRSEAAGALAVIPDPRAVEPLIAVLWDPNGFVSWNALFALGQIRDPRAVPALVGCLADWRAGPEAAETLSLLNWTPPSDRERIHLLVGKRDGAALRTEWDVTKRILLDDIQGGNRLAVENALYAFIAIGKEEIIPDLVRILDAQGDKDLAEVYLNCGHPRLVEAANTWARLHAYSILSVGGAPPVGWGRM